MPGLHTKSEQGDEHYHHQRRHQYLLQGLGYRHAGSVQPRLAGQLGQLGITNAVSGIPRLPLHCPRPPWPRPLKPALVAAVTPQLLQSASNPHGVPLKKYDDNRASSTADRSQFYREIASGSFYGANRPGAKVSQGVMDRFWLQGITAGHHNTYACIKAFSETDFTADLKKFTIPTLIIHGNDDQIMPIAVSALRASDLIDNAILKIYEGAPHGLTDTHKDQLNADLPEFLR